MGRGVRRGVGVVRAGVVYQQRTWLVRWANRKVFTGARWVAWLFPGWPFTVAAGGTLGVVANLFPAVQIASYVPWTIAAFVMVEYARLTFTHQYGWVVAVLTALTGVGWWWQWTHNVDADTAKLVRKLLFWGWVAGSWVWTLFHFPAVVLLVPVVLVAVAADLMIGARDPRMRLIRYWAQWNRERPTTWNILGAQTLNIQSVDDAGVEGNVAAAANNRAVLEAPGVHPFARFDFEAGITEQRVFAPPGRNLLALKKVLPQWSAMWPTISNFEDSMELVFDETTEGDSGFASTAVLRIHWDVFGNNGGNVELRGLRAEALRELHREFPTPSVGAGSGLVEF